MADAKNSLVDLTDPQRDNYRVKGSDFPAKVKGAQGASKDAQDKLVPQSTEQKYARHNADDGAGISGAGTPSKWGDEGRAFSVQTNKGEGSESAKSVSIPESVDLVSGRISAKGYKSTPVMEVEQADVSLGKH